VRIDFLSLLDIANLSVHETGHNTLVKTPRLPIHETSIEQHIEDLELRKRDARIGKEAGCAALNALAVGLTPGNPVLLSHSYKSSEIKVQSQTLRLSQGH
jgi:hypothetical protein